MTQLDYAALGFKAGLEIHQQLDTPKLFCRCASRLDESDAADFQFLRALHPTASELGEVDRAAVEEARKRLHFEYLGSRTSACLVEADEEPPHAMTPEALDVALETALLLHAKPVDEVHIMRKIVVDGSNTSGFQRTSLVATQGLVESAHGNVRMATFCLEEDSARRLDRVGNLQRYRLDRLGIPLIEIATEPDLKGPAHAREVAEAIGMALRATGKVKRGIGTIRQDLNVSIREGARVEIKGVQELRLIETAVEWEVRRQVHLLDIKKEIVRRGAKEADYLREPIDVTDVFQGSDAKSLAGIAKGERVLAVALPHLSGLLGKKGKEEIPPPRIGREVADYAKIMAGVKGIFHSDELPAYGLTAEQCGEVASRLNLGTMDAFACVVAPRAQAAHALEGVLRRCAMLLSGVPEETRDLEPDGTSRYLRPLPGGARMYPETDVPPVRLDAAKMDAIRLSMASRGVMPASKAKDWLRMQWPALGEVHVQGLLRSGRYPQFASLMNEFPALPIEDATSLLVRDEADAFTAIARSSGLPRESARIVLRLWDEAVGKYEVATGGNTELGVNASLVPLASETLRAVSEGKLTKEGILETLTEALVTKRSIADIVAAKHSHVDRQVVEADIDRIIRERSETVLKQKERAAGAIMGPIMAKYRGKIAGDELSRMVNERVKVFLDSGG